MGVSLVTVCCDALLNKKVILFISTNKSGKRNVTSVESIEYEDTCRGSEKYSYSCIVEFVKL